MRLRRASNHSLPVCLETLRPLSDELRLRYVRHHEANIGSLLLRDPIELEPGVGELVSALEAEAKQRLASGELGVGRGGSGRMWGWMKEALSTRHGIVWRTPLEMTPDVVLD
jgi:hypothetical protein